MDLRLVTVGAQRINRKMMQHSDRPISLQALGVSALVLAVIFSVLSFAIYGGQMGPHIIATAVGVLGEAALVVLVLDTMSRSSERREWRFAEEIVGRAAAACMVDLLRLSGLRWCQLDRQAAIPRYQEFLEILRVHIADLRSNLDGLALGAEPRLYEQARLIERRAVWLCNGLGHIPDGPRPEFAIIADTVKCAATLLDATANRQFESAISRAEPMLSNVGVLQSPEYTAEAGNRFWQVRMRMQAEFLRHDPEAAHGIWKDIDQELAVPYFAIDYLLIRHTHL